MSWVRQVHNRDFRKYEGQRIRAASERGRLKPRLKGLACCARSATTPAVAGCRERVPAGYAVAGGSVQPAQAGFVAAGPTGAVSTARAPSQREHAVPSNL